MNTKVFLISCVIAVAVLERGGLLAEEDASETEVKCPFYAQACNYGEPDPRYPTLTDHIKLLAELGYDGYSHFALDTVPEVLKAVDDNHLKLFQVYAPASVDPAAESPYDPRLPQVIASLKGRQTMVGLILSGKPPSTTEWDPQAVKIVQEVADMASAAGLQVVLYPHQGSWLERVQDGLRVIEKANRQNVGVVFSEVHFFLCDEEKNLEATLKAVRPCLYAVNINGTDGGASKDLAHFLQPLDRGSFDNLKLLKLLKELAYVGPIGFHGYAIQGDVRENLLRTLEQWKVFSAQLDLEKP